MLKRFDIIDNSRKIFLHSSIVYRIKRGIDYSSRLLSYMLRYSLTGNKYNQFITQLYNKMERKIDYTVVEKSG